MTNGHSHLDHGDSGQGLANPSVPHILLVEDDDVMREMVAEALRREGYQVTECEDAFPWLRFCLREVSPRSMGVPSNRYDVVVSDIRMPGISGLDVLKFLKDIGCELCCPATIFITAFGDENTHRIARELGAAAVLDKPFAIKELIGRIRAVATI